MIALLQKHTVDLYQLESKAFERKTIAARDLLVMSRFDLFAKLFYIKYRKKQPELAKKVYIEHILVFNPDGKEPGRDDKNGVEDFIRVFDQLIDYFEHNEFDPTISLIPVSKDGVALDGSHRIAALAYFDKKIEILQYDEVKSVCKFDYQYFTKRGLTVATADAIVFQTLEFNSKLFVTCLWPKLGSLENRKWALEQFQNEFEVFYVKNKKLTLNGLGLFMYEIYKHQDWVGNAANNYQGARSKAMSCYSGNGIVQFVLFSAQNLEVVMELKDKIRKHYQLDKHALHITDNAIETRELLELVLTQKVDLFTSSNTRFSDCVSEWKQRFNNVFLLNLKVKIAKVLSKIGLYK